jgi:asparagine synthase (glutamine-hydrolysing)
MIEKITLQDLGDPIILESDIAGQEPIYILCNNSELFYSKNIVQLLDGKKLSISSKGISFLLKNGVVPSPHTIYRNLYILSIGDKVEISKENSNLKLNFSKSFSFSHKNKNFHNDFNTDEALSLIANATINKIDNQKNSFLFHSAGKDSNTILLSLNEANYKDVTLVTHQSNGKSDESKISKKIADRLGYEHKILFEPEILTSVHKNSFENYFKNIPFPVMDVVSLAYPIYDTQIDFTNSNIIDGMGNDVFIGHIPSKKEYIFANYFSKLSFLKPIANKIKSENYLHILGYDKIEWVGLIGFMDDDASNIYEYFISPDQYWKTTQIESSNLNYLDLRAKIRGGIIDQEIFMRKVRNFGDINNSNVIFPWTDKSVAEYFYNLDNKYLFDDKLLKNKLILRQILNDKLDLDSDKLGKLGYTFDYWKILQMMINDVKEHIIECKLWKKQEIEKLFNRLYSRAKKNDRYANRAKSLIQRLYLISAWYNNNKYIER